MARTFSLTLVLFLLACGAEEPDPPDLTDITEWRQLSDVGDRAADCDAGDAGCTADIARLLYTVDEGKLFVDLRFHGSFPDAGSFELFFFPGTANVDGHSLRVTGTLEEYWDADCAAAGRDLKHSGCHWADAALPPSLDGAWIDEQRYVCGISVADLDFDNETSVFLGAAAAPTGVNVTADFTDRHPDALWVTATEVQGLAEVLP